MTYHFKKLTDQRKTLLNLCQHSKKDKEKKQGQNRNIFKDVYDKKNNVLCYFSTAHMEQ